jgi:uncharacterized 2Fe-2S/4Fe-4S cluster protein (DUF4445 family)
MHKVILKPLGTELNAEDGTPLKDLLFEHSVEFPCGGQGRCRGCRVRIAEGDLPVNAAQHERLSTQEIEEGWRLACQCKVESALTLELRQWDASILGNDAEFVFTPRTGLGVAIDIGTTTLAAQLLDLRTGAVLGVRTALNPQARYGADVMSRVQYAVTEQGAKLLQEAILRQAAALIRQLVHAAEADIQDVTTVVLVGNTVMHHLFCGIDLEPLSRYPFETANPGLQKIEPSILGAGLSAAAEIWFLPCPGSFVGSDILAGVVATGLHLREKPSLLVDLGTNGEIVVGNRHKILCASTAAGPAFEGARISMGMRAATGAIWKVQPPQEGQDRLCCEVLGNVLPVGLCGSGLVDAAAVGLELGKISNTGRLKGGADLLLQEPVLLTQTDIRQLQLAKGAIAAGIQILLRAWGTQAEDLEHVYLAGAFGNYTDRASARRIGLIEFAPERVEPIGNSALLGAKIALFAEGPQALAYTEIMGICTHVGLTSDPQFQDIYVECMCFPG